MILDFYDRDKAPEIAGEIIRNSRDVYSIPVRNIKASAIREIFGAKKATASNGRYELELEMESEIPAFCGIVKGEGSDCLWSNIPPLSGRFQRRNRLDRLSFATQILLCSGKITKAPCCTVFRELVKRMSDRGDEDRTPFYINLLKRDFNLEEYKKEVYSDEMLAVVTKNFAYAYLTDLTRNGEFSVDEIQKYYFTKELERLATLLDYWKDFRPSPSTNKHRYTVNILLSSINDTLARLVGNGEMQFLDPIDLPHDNISMDEVNDDGEVRKEYSIKEIAAQGDIPSVSDSAANMYMFLDNALLLLKNVHGTEITKSVPTLFPEKRLPMSPELVEILAPTEQDRIRDSEWVAYQSSSQIAFGQYKLKHSNYKARGVLLEGDEKWRIFKKPLYTLSFGKGEKQSCRFHVDAAQIEELRLRANPVYEFDGSRFRYVRCSKKSPNPQKNMYLWLEVDEEGRPIKELEFTAKGHASIRDENPELISYTPRGISNITSTLRNEFDKCREIDNFLEGFAQKGGETAAERIFSCVSEAVLEAFQRRSDISGEFSTEGVIHDAFSSLHERMSDSELHEYADAQGFFGRMEDNFRRALHREYENKLYTFMLADKFITLSSILSPETCSEEVLKYARTSELDMAVPGGETAQKSALMATHSDLYKRAVSHGQDFSELGQCVQNMEYVRENFPGSYGDYAKAVREYYGQELYASKKMECLLPEGVEMLPLWDIPKRFADAATRGVMRELGVITSIVKGYRLSDRPLSFAAASSHISHDMLASIIDKRLRIAEKVFNPAPGKVLASYSPFIVFGGREGFKEIKDSIEAKKFSDIKSMSILRRNRAPQPRMEANVGIPKEAGNAGACIKTSSGTDRLPLIHPGNAASKVHTAAINRLIEAVGSDDLPMKNLAIDTLGCFISKLAEISGQYPKGKIWDEIFRKSDFELESKSKIAHAATRLAEQIESPQALMSHMESAGILKAFEKLHEAEKSAPKRNIEAPSR